MVGRTPEFGILLAISFATNREFPVSGKSKISITGEARHERANQVSQSVAKTRNGIGIELAFHVIFRRISFPELKWALSPISS
jgi:hypothetical protein